MKTNNFLPFGPLILGVSTLLLGLFPQLFAQGGKKLLQAWNKPVPESIDDLQSIQAKVQSSLENIRKSIVCVEAEDGAGSGVVVSSDGLILTAAHVIGESGRTMNIVFPDGTKVDALSLGGSELSDAGMLKIIEEGEWEFAPMALANVSKIGDWCFALGHPSGYDGERGMVLRIGRLIRKKDETLQTDCRLLGGDSGGPLFSIDGELIGIHSRISQSPEENFHTPIESFLSNWEYFLNEELHTFGTMQEGGFLGVLCEESGDGLRILEVLENTPAESAGIRKGDILKLLDGVPLDTREKLTILVSTKPPGTFVVINFIRDQRESSVRIELGERVNRE